MYNYFNACNKRSNCLPQFNIRATHPTFTLLSPYFHPTFTLLTPYSHPTLTLRLLHVLYQGKQPDHFFHGKGFNRPAVYTCHSPGGEE